MGSHVNVTALNEVDFFWALFREGPPLAAAAGGVAATVYYRREAVMITRKKLFDDATLAVSVLDALPADCEGLALE